ncbi:SET domain-containing protein-lysine N-methyltransferase [Endozoicomonas sp. SCSIO W0465]|uniref:SET domain-containing protein-lysine N-methyltransferase n=1 Tax=Endozoicomonas sp. SCSIO W0465 TaxID=2918516 RepID=UPI00353221A3
MCHGKGLPEKAKMEAFLKLGCLKEEWQGIDEAVRDQPLDRALVTHISSMWHSKGLPEKAKVEAFLKLGCLKRGWQGIDEAVRDQPLDWSLVTSISSMCNGKGLPEKAKVEAFLKLGCLKDGWQGIDEAVKDQPIDRRLVTHISSMCNGKGLPAKAKVEAFLKLGCLKEGWQGIDEAVKGKPLNRVLISSISSMCHGKGLPEKAKVKAILKRMSENTQDDEIIVIKEEATDVISLPHRINDLAPLWVAEPSVKREVGDSRQRQTTFFSQSDIPNDRTIRKSIHESIARYQDLDDKQRAQYLQERMSVQKHDGSIFSELKGQEEVVASRDILQWELLGHYAGKQYHDNTYQQRARVMGAALANIDSYSFAPAHGVFISAYRQGNITSLINAFSTYSDKEKNSPEQNVSFLRHRNQQGQWMVFIIAIKSIPANEILWIDYGEQYWQAARAPIAISDDNSEAL